MSKTKTTKKQSNKGTLQLFQGTAMLLVTVSISFSSYVVIMGVDDIVSKILIVPQLLFAVITLFRKFTKGL